MHDIPEEAVKAAVEAVDEGVNWVAGLFGEKYDNAEEVMRSALTAALPFLTVQGAVKKLEWTKGVVDIASPHPGMKYVACSTTPKGSWAFWLNDAPETRAVFTSEEAAKAAAQADYETRVMSAIETVIPVSQPSAARELALEEAARVAEQFRNNDWIAHDMRTGVFPKQSEPGIAIAAAIRALNSNGGEDE